ncbi:MAG: hypothetical protein K0R28_6178 [Paenibacillus sp.]|nr:hypothetical protein [Paenibacillus sp.]
MPFLVTVEIRVPYLRSGSISEVIFERLLHIGSHQTADSLGTGGSVYSSSSSNLANLFDAKYSITGKSESIDFV